MAAQIVDKKNKIQSTCFIAFVWFVYSGLLSGTWQCNTADGVKNNQPHLWYKELILR